MTASITAPSELQAAIAAKETAETSGDLDSILATFCDNPVFEFRPVGRRLAGRENVRRFYQQMLSDFVPRVVGYRAVSVYWNDSGMAMEEEITIRADDGASEVFQFVVTTSLIDGRLSGERLYGDERFFRLLVGDLFDGAEVLVS
jgi:ketosteroid isomerase-like protein